MMRILKQIFLVLIAMIAFANLGKTHNFARDNDIYISLNADMIFIDKEFTKNDVGIGGGGGFAVGYQVNGWHSTTPQGLQFEFSANYQYYNNERTEIQNVTDEGRAFFSNSTQNFGIPQVVPRIDFIGTTATTTVSGNDHFIPITVGVRMNYILHLNGEFDPYEKWSAIAMRVGIAGGFWIHHVNRTSTKIINFAAAAAGDPDLVQFMSTTATDTATELRGILVPSLSFDYAPTDNFTLSLASKFYIIFNGYSDNYSDAARAIADDPNFTPSIYNEVDKNFWYGSISFETSFAF